MNKDLTDITLIVDRSGSMTSCREEAQNGINHFIKAQKETPGKATLTLVQFDTEYEFVHNGKPINEVGDFSLVPRGMTALLDSVGRAINEAGKRIESLPEDQRPGLVVFGITTDGQENASHEFTRAKIKEMIEHQRSVYNWQFTFLGANQDAFLEAASLGIAATATANFSTKNSEVAYAAMSNSVSRSRMSASVGGAVNMSYTADEKKGMK